MKPINNVHLMKKITQSKKFVLRYIRYYLNIIPAIYLGLMNSMKHTHTFTQSYTNRYYTRVCVSLSVVVVYGTHS